MEKSIAVIGGDLRSALLYELLVQSGQSAVSYGLGREDGLPCLVQALMQADYVVAPLPLCKKPGLLNAPLHSRPIPLEELLHYLQPHQHLLAGVIPPDTAEKLREQGIAFTDLMEDEAFVSANVIPTVEGTLQLAMERMDTTLHGSEVLVLGYGRIGKELARVLPALGARVWMYARREDSLMQAMSRGTLPVRTEEMGSIIGHMDLIINTIPAPVLGRSLLQRMRPDSLLIDLASAPGGTDFEAAQELGRQAYLDLGLPGKVAPRSAAAYIMQALERLKNLER